MTSDADYETGWFADIDEEQSGAYRWQPCLQLGSVCPSLPVWFQTEAECLAFIRDEIVGQGLIHG